MIKYIFLLLISFNVLAATGPTTPTTNTSLHKVYTYTVYTGKLVTFSWTMVPMDLTNVDHFEVQVFNFEKNVIVFTGSVKAPTMNINFTPQKMGHYIFKVRAVNSVGASGWADSTDPNGTAQVEGKYMRWWLYAYLQPAGSITIQ